MKKFILYSLASIISLTASSSAVYFGLKIADNFKRVDDIEEDEDNEDVVEESNFSKTLNNLMTSKQIESSSITLNLTSINFPGDLNINLSNVKIDISDLQKLSLKATINIKYNSIDETLNIAYQGNTSTAYVSYASKAYMLQLKPTLSSLISLIKGLGINIPSIGSASFDLSSLTSAISLDSFKVTESNTMDGFAYTLDFDDMNIGGKVISGISLILESDKEFNIKSIRINENNGQNGKINLSDMVQLSLSGNVSARKDSDFKNDDSGYTDISSSTNSIVTTLSKLLNEKRVDAAFSLDFKNNSTTGLKSSKVDGNLKVDLSNVALKDITKGEFELSLNHHNEHENLNLINAHYKNSTTYLKVNDLFKGKIRNSTIDDLFSLISNAVNENMYQEIEKQLNTVLSKIDLNKLKDIDLNVYKGYIKDFYFDNSILKLTINAKLFNLGDYDINIEINFDNNQISNISLKGMRYQDYEFDFALTPTFPEGVNFSTIEGEYKDYQGMVPIFSTLLNYIDKRQASINYSLVYSSQSSSYSASGKLSADLKGVDNLSLLGLQNGNYYVSFDTKIKDNSQNLNLIYQDQNIYFDYNNGVFKQSISNTEVDKIKNVISSNSTGEMNDAFSNINNIIKEISSSKQYQEDISKIKAGSLRPLESFISIDKDNLNADKLILELNVPYVLKNTSLENKVGAITLTLDTNDNEIENISVSSTIDQTSSISFSLNFEEYDSSYLLNDEKKKLYREITDADKLAQSFCSLPLINQKEFSLKLAGKVLDDQNNKIAEIASGSGIAVDYKDKNKPNAYGSLTINHPSLDTLLSDSKVNYNKYVDQKIRFKYQTIEENSTLDGQFVAEYNDKMHILLKSSTISEVLNNVKLADSETNLLHRYLKVLTNTTSATGAGLIDFINTKDFTKLLDYPYIKKVEILSDRIDLIFDGKLVDASSENNDQHISVYFDKGEKPRITKATLSGKLANKNIEVSISLGDISEVEDPSVKSETNTNPMMLYSDDTKNNFVDLNGFAMLSKCLIDTTENNYFNLSGTFKVKGKILSIPAANLNSAIDCRVTIFDEHAYAYLSFNNSPTLNSDDTIKSVKSVNDKGFYMTEFFVSEKEIEVCQSKNNGKKITSEVFKTDDVSLLDDIFYYVMSYILDGDNQLPMGSTIMGNIYKSMNETVSADSKSSTRLTDDFSNILSSNTKYIEDENNPYFHLEMNLNNIFDGSLSSMNLSFSDTSIDLYHQKMINKNDRTPLSKMSVKTNLSFLGLIDINLHVLLNADCKNITASDATNTYMNRYYTFTEAFKNKFGGFTPFDNNDDTFLTNKPIYSISSYTITKNFLGIVNGYKLVDNASDAKTYFDKSNIASEDLVFIYPN